MIYISVIAAFIAGYQLNNLIKHFRKEKLVEKCIELLVEYDITNGDSRNFEDKMVHMLREVAKG